MKMFYIICLTILLTGCAAMNDKFDCNVRSGGKCLPVHQINRLADQGEFSGDSTESSSNSNIILNASQGYPIAAYSGQPIRYGETVQRIWIAPYKDKSDNYHEPSYVYTVVRKGHWIGDPVQSIVN